MTGRRSDEVTDIPQEHRSRDSQTVIPERDTGVVQDSPGTAMNTDDQGLLDAEGNYKDEDSMIGDTAGDDRPDGL